MIVITQLPFVLMKQIYIFDENNDFIILWYYQIIYSVRIPKNKIIEIIARGEAECNYFSNCSSRNPIPIL